MKTTIRLVCLFLALSVSEARAGRVSAPAQDTAAAGVKNAGAMKHGMAVGADKRTLNVLATEKIESMKAVPQTAKAPAAASPYGATYKASNVNLAPGADAAVEVTLTNTGSLAWDANGQFRLAYHLYQGSKQLSFGEVRTAIPAAVASGGNITVQARVKAPKDPGVYTMKWDLVHENVTWFSWKKVPTGDVTLTVAAAAAPDDAVEQAKKILSRMVGALNGRNVDDLMSPVGPTASVSLNGRATDAGDYSRSISSALPFLTDLVWDAQVTEAVRDPKTGAVRIRARSTYSAKLAEPVGVTSASLAKPAELVSAQKRVTEAFNSAADEIYEFKPDASGKLQVTEIVSALPLDAKLLDRTAAMGAEWDVKVVVFGLFYYIEKNDLGNFAGLIGSDFINNDDNGFKHSKTDFLESAKADLDHLTSIDHSVRVEDIQMSVDRTRARVPVSWDRRARIANKNTEWTNKDQKTTLTLLRAPGSGFGLVLIEGNPLLGNSSRMTRKTLINAGELDGTSVANPLAVSDAREIAVATSADFPENLPSNSRAGVITASQTFTFTGAVQSFTVPVSTALTIKSWGAGGGGGGWAADNGADGGGGAYATTTVLLTKGDVIQIYVGGGGDSGANSSTNTGGGPGGFGYGSGAAGGNSGDQGNSGGGGGGGGSTAVTNQSGTTFYVVAAGGGGGGGAATVAKPGAAGGAGGQNGSTATNGGGAGGTTGASGSKDGTAGTSPAAGLDGGGGGGGGGG